MIKGERDFLVFRVEKEKEISGLMMKVEELSREMGELVRRNQELDDGVERVRWGYVAQVNKMIT